MNASTSIRRVSIGAPAALFAVSAAVVFAVLTALAVVPGAAAGVASTDHVRITLSGEAAAAACSFVKKGGAAGAEQKGPVLEVPCDRAVTMRCGGPGLEPVDVAAADVCRTGRVPLVKANDVTVTVAQHVELTIEWLALSVSTQQVLATRTSVVDKHLTIPIAPAADRFVRFSRPGTSPVTMPAARLAGPSPWRLPDPRAGGEVVALIQYAAVLPTAYRIQGDAGIRTIGRDSVASDRDTSGRNASGRNTSDRDAPARDTSDRDNLGGVDAHDPHTSTLFARGLSAGAYDIVPIYQGGLTGEPIPIVIQPTKSTIALLRPEAVGEAFVTAPRASCDAASLFGLSSVTQGASGTHRESVFQTQDVSPCQWTVAGLKAGRYDAWLRGTASGAGATGIDIPAQSRVSIAIAAASVNVTGRVLHGDEPAANMTLVFVIDKDGFSATTATDSDGAYALALDRPGDYRVMLHDETMHAMRRARVAAGDNTVNFTIKRGASLRARVLNPQSTEKTVVEIRKNDATHSISRKDLKDGAREAKWAALDYGTYEVFASQGSFASDIKSVVIDEDRPDATVDLTLDENRATLTLRDDGGQPVPNARFYFLIPQPPEVSPGVYELRGVAPGTTLRVRATSGMLVPVCRVAPRNQSMDVVMTTGRAVTLQFSEQIKSLDNQGGYLTGLPGSDCPVPLSDFASTPLGTPTPDSSRFLISNFPPSARLTLIDARGERALVVGADGIVNVVP